MTSRIRHYTLGPLLGEGAMGKVYLATDLRLDRQVAIKRLRDDLVADETLKDRIWREARAATRINHRNVVKILDVVEDDDGVPALVMEYVAGEPLSTRIAGGDFDLREFVRIAGQVAAGLHAAHKQGLVHRDLKPSNILLAEDGSVVLLDFGLAKAILRSSTDDPLAARASGSARNGLADYVAGTIDYMAPEQLAGAPSSAASDLFSLGVILYEMISGAHPFRRASREATVEAISTSTPVSLSASQDRFNEQVCKLVHQLLEKDPDRRPGGADDVEHTLRDLDQELGLLDDLRRGGQGAALTDVAVPLPVVLVVGSFDSEARGGRFARLAWDGARSAAVDLLGDEDTALQFDANELLGYLRSGGSYAWTRRSTVRYPRPLRLSDDTDAGTPQFAQALSQVLASTHVWGVIAAGDAANTRTLRDLLVAVDVPLLVTTDSTAPTGLYNVHSGELRLAPTNDWQAEAILASSCPETPDSREFMGRVSIARAAAPG